MSVIIKGMPMPDTCQKCKIDSNFCDLWNYCQKDVERHVDCPIVELPESMYVKYTIGDIFPIQPVAEEE